MEYVFKRIALGPNISAIPPSDYKLRFDKFIDDIFDIETKNN